jgi:prepilin-type N-terminal cleavage/methylation domain-containing protein
MSISMASLRGSAAVAACGFTLVEVMVAALLSGLVLTGVLTASLQLMRSSVRITQYAEMSSQVRSGLEQLGHDLKIATAINWNSASDITLTLPTASGSTTQVTYAWTSATQGLFLVPGADSTVTTGRVFLVRGIPALADGSAGVTFARYDRDGNAATTDLSTKRVQVILNVSRLARTAAATTDTAVSASFILRNKPTS